MVKSTRKAMNEPSIVDIELFVAMLESSCKIQNSTALHFFRKAFANVPHVPNVVIKDSFYSRIKNGVLILLRGGDLDTDGKINAVWIITNMCCISSEVTHMFVTANVVYTLTQLLRSETSRLVNQAIWAIANIAADCQSCKLMCRKPTLLRILAKQLQSATRLDTSEVRNLLWCLSNILSGDHFHLPSQLARLLVRSLSDAYVDNQLMNRTKGHQKVLWTLAHLAVDPSDSTRIDMVLAHPSLLSCVIQQILDPSTDESCHESALRLLGNVAVGNDNQTDRLLGLPHFRDVLNWAMRSKTHRGEAAWILSNIAAGPPRHVDFVIEDYDEFYAWMISGIFSGERRFRKESLWIVGNLLATSDDAQRALLVSIGIVQHLPTLLQVDDVRLNAKAANVAVDLLRENPEQWGLFKQLEVVKWIEKAGVEFSQRKNELQALMDELAPPEHDESEPKANFICYTFLDD